MTHKLVINGHFEGQPVTGVQRYALELLNEFNKKGFSYELINPPEQLSSQAARQIWMQSVMPIKLSKNQFLWSPTNTGPAFKREQVITLHDIADQLYPEWFSKKYVNWRRIILPGLLKRVEGIVTVSEFSKKTIIEKYPFTHGKVEVIPNGVNHDHFYPRANEEKSNVQKHFKLHKPYVITVSSLDPRKNIEGLVKAWNHLPERIRNDYELVVVGGEDQLFKFSLSAPPHSSIRFLGYVDSNYLPALYSSAELFIYPSLFEGFGLPVLEAMACGVPVLMSDCTSLSELAGDHVITFNPEDNDELADKINDTLLNYDDTRKKSIKAEEFSKNYTWSKSATKTYNYLKKFL